MARQPLVVTVEGLDELQEALAKFPKQWRMIATKALKPGLAIFETEVKTTARRDMGHTAASVGSEIVRGMGSEIIGKVGSNLEHAPFALEHGRGPGGMPPVDIIEGWAARHGMVGMGFVIARAIARRGVKAPRTMSKAVRKKSRAVVKAIEKGISRELKRLGL